MNTNRILLSGLAGGVTLFILGFLTWGILLAGFMEANAGSATGVAKEPMVWWAMILGNLIWGILLAYIMDFWAGISTLRAGAIAGGIIAFMTWLSADLMMFATSNVITLAGAIVDAIASGVVGVVVGGVIGLVLGRMKTAS